MARLGKLLNHITISANRFIGRKRSVFNVKGYESRKDATRSVALDE
jgi:hypothetical protein